MTDTEITSLTRQLAEAKGEIERLKEFEERYSIAETALTVETANREATEHRLAQAEKDQVWGFYEGEIPVFEQGPGHHELQSLVTAAEVTGYVTKIAQLTGGDGVVVKRELLAGIEITLAYIIACAPSLASRKLPEQYKQLRDILSTGTGKLVVRKYTDADRAWNDALETVARRCDEARHICLTNYDAFDVQAADVWGLAAKEARQLKRTTAVETKRG